MDLFLQNILANSIPLGVIVIIVYVFFKKNINRLGVIEDKLEAAINVLLNGNYEKFMQEYHRLKEERADKNKLN